MRCDPWEGNTEDWQNKTDLCCSESWVPFFLIYPYFCLFLSKAIPAGAGRDRRLWWSPGHTELWTTIPFLFWRFCLYFPWPIEHCRLMDQLMEGSLSLRFTQAMQMQRLVSCWPLMFEHHGVIKTDINICVFYRPIIVWGFEMSFSNPLRGRGGMESLSVSKQLG